MREVLLSLVKEFEYKCSVIAAFHNGSLTIFSYTSSHLTMDTEMELQWFHDELGPFIPDQSLPPPASMNNDQEASALLVSNDGLVSNVLDPIIGDQSLLNPVTSQDFDVSNNWDLSWDQTALQAEASQFMTNNLQQTPFGILSNLDFDSSLAQEFPHDPLVEAFGLGHLPGVWATQNAALDIFIHNGGLGMQEPFCFIDFTANGASDMAQLEPMSTDLEVRMADKSSKKPIGLELRRPHLPKMSPSGVPSSSSRYESFQDRCAFQNVRSDDSLPGGSNKSNAPHSGALETSQAIQAPEPIVLPLHLHNNKRTRQKRQAQKQSTQGIVKRATRPVKTVPVELQLQFSVRLDNVAKRKKIKNRARKVCLRCQHHKKKVRKTNPTCSLI